MFAGSLLFFLLQMEGHSRNFCVWQNCLLRMPAQYWNWSCYNMMKSASSYIIVWRPSSMRAAFQKMFIAIYEWCSFASHRRGSWTEVCRGKAASQLHTAPGWIWLPHSKIPAKNFHSNCILVEIIFSLVGPLSPYSRQESMHMSWLTRSRPGGHLLTGWRYHLTNAIVVCKRISAIDGYAECVLRLYSGLSNWDLHLQLVYDQMEREAAEDVDQTEFDHQLEALLQVWPRMILIYLFSVLWGSLRPWIVSVMQERVPWFLIFRKPGRQYHREFGPIKKHSIYRENLWGAWSYKFACCFGGDSERKRLDVLCM